MAFDRHFAGLSDTLVAYSVHGAKAASDTYYEKLGAITADDATQRGWGGLFS